MPMGFEYGWSRRLDPVIVRDEPEPKRFDLGEFIAEVNAMKKAVPALNEEGPQRLLTGPDDPLVVLERQTESGEERALVLVNTHERQSREIELETFLGPSDPRSPTDRFLTRPSAQSSDLGWRSSLLGSGAARRAHAIAGPSRAGECRPPGGGRACKPTSSDVAAGGAD